MSHSPPTFTTLSLPIHTEILERLTGTRYSRGRKREFYAAVKAREALTPLSRELVQEKLWADLLVPIKRLGEV
ncbi:Protein of unknown function [Pyronema omphalodes CBS 100304]|uniref:Uncharacterized protein n=1 Tax=Pyronema omphalodes (strain CBS 100304) TaxID=1076935 RepID=U4L1X8_PYROM|nr:Protein of unknown function [Pyronema omphalodes CBS 100304]